MNHQSCRRHHRHSQQDEGIVRIHGVKEAEVNADVVEDSRYHQRNRDRNRVDRKAEAGKVRQGQNQRVAAHSDSEAEARQHRKR